ncbi:hypothetical protein P8452_54793 [Trifolium repens]|nr:hypothetical protein P8452_54793 [Trifolium repens]
MFPCVFNFLFCVVSILSICLLCTESFHMNNCVETERQALLKFKDAIIHGSVILTSWKGEECCKWEGISCDNLTGHVTSLYLQPLDYSSWPEVYKGKLDSSICELQHLTSLNLKNNYLQGNIPKCIGSLGQLIELKLSGNQFVSVIPSSLRNLSNLQTLDLSYNYYMISNNLEWLSHLSNLRYLDLSYVNLTLAIDWLSSISKISSLNEIRLLGCELHQVTPRSILRLNSSMSLKYLDLGGNSLNSSILPWVINVSKVLTDLDLSSNSLQQIPDAFGNMIFLRYLDLSDNELQGNIPKSFRNMCQLQQLELNSNKLSSKLSDNIHQLGCAPNVLAILGLSNNPFNARPLPDFSFFSSLETLSLRSTNIVGTLPKSFVHLPSLKTLDLSHNQLNGVDIIDNAHLSTLQSLDLSFNQLNGSLPLLEITKLPSLQLLDLSHNQLSGQFPHITAQFSNLMMLLLSSNKLSGVINEVILSNLSQLKTLDVTQNSISFNISSYWIPPFQLDTLYASSCTLGPKFPAWLKHQRELMSLDISNTGISDSFPKWFWNLASTFQYLNVSHNKLEGPLPKSFPSMKVNDNNYVWDFSLNNLNGSLPPFPGLNALFLSNNMFTGSLSSFCTSSSLNLSYLDLSNNLLAGKLSDCWEKFQSLTLIDVGDNNLQGILPKWIGYHLHQLIVLRLRGNKFKGNIPTRNNLTGFIPNNIGHIERLESLDLSRNHLYGKMPSSFSNLTFLSYMNLSFNNLEGEIPLSTQLQSFDPSSFEGNARLCGPPLINLCPDDAISPTRSHEKHVTDEDEDKLITFGFYVSLVVGFFVGFWGVCGTLVIKASWRHAYFQFFKNMNDRIHVLLSVFVNRLKNRFEVEG